MKQLTHYFRFSLLLIAGAWALSAQAASGTRITQEAYHQSSALYTETAADMTVQTASGDLTVHRYFRDGEWVFFPGWGDLRIATTVGVDGQPADITFRESDYQREFSNVVMYRFDEKNVIYKKDANTWRWRHTNGRWIDFDLDGRSKASGKNNITYFTITRNADGDITQVNDQRGQVAVTLTYHASGKPATLTDYAGRTVSYTYDASDNLVGVTDVLGGSWAYTYRTATIKGEAQQIITSRSEPSGRTLVITYQSTTGGSRCIAGSGYSWSYDEATQTWKESYTNCTSRVEVQGMLVMQKLSDQLGLIKQFAYNYNPNKRQYTFMTIYPDGRYHSRVMDLRGRTVERTVNGKPTQKDLWINNNRERIEVDARGHETLSDYDQWGNRLKSVYADGTVETWQYRAGTNRVTQHTAGNGVITTYDYNDNGQVTEMVEAKGSPQQRTTTYTYNSYGERSGKTVSDGNGTSQSESYSYDNYNNVTQITNAEGNNTTFSNYTATGKPRKITDAEGNETTLTYDNAGNVLTRQIPVDKANNKQTVYSYDAMGNTTGITTPGGLQTTMAYDVRNRQQSVTSPSNGTTTYNYSNEQLTQISNNGNSQSMAYDDDGNLKSQTDAMGNVITYDNGTADNSAYPNLLNSITYPTYSESYAYDKQNRRIKTTKTDPTGTLADIVTQQNYDNVGNLAYTIDGNGQKTTYAYDPLNRQISEANEAAQETTAYNYDVFDNLLGVTNAKGTTIRTYTYDKLGQTLTETTPDGRTIQFEYDKVGNLIKKTSPGGQIETHEYVDNQLKTTRYYQNAAAQNSNTVAEEIAYTYDADGRLKTAIHKVEDNLSDKYEYSYQNGLLSQQKTTFYDETGAELFAKTLVYTYHPDGQLKTYANAEGVTVSYAYNANQQLTKLTIPTVGDITQSDFNWLAPQKVTYPNGVTTDYQFDALMRIKQIHTQKGSTDIMNYGYVYDKVGNITRKTTEKGVSNYRYDKAYRLTGATHPTLTNETFSYDKVGNRLSTQASATPWTYNNADQLLTTPEATYQYNANGHTKSVDYTDTALPDMAYSYDAKERLKRVLKTDDGSQIQSNRYDYNNRRLVKTTASATTYFLYSVYGLEAEFDASGDLIQGYFFGSDVYSTNPILTYKPNTSNGLDYHYYHNDHLFTPQRLTDSTGTLSWSANYSAFGKATITKETITNNLRFPGQYYDTDIKLAQNYYRDYSAELGRYVESDPIGLDGGVNTFGYVGQNPLLYYDEKGQFFWVAAGLVGVLLTTYFYLYYKCLKSCDKAFPPDPLCPKKNNESWQCRTHCVRIGVMSATPVTPNTPGVIQSVTGG